MEIQALSVRADRELRDIYAGFDAVAMRCHTKIQEAFAEFHVGERHFAASTGYGYNDDGRDVLDKVYARVFGAQSALVRHNMISGTHALTVGLFAVLRPGDILLSVCGKPYDTLEKVIGIGGKDNGGSLADFGVEYREIALASDEPARFDFPAVELSLSNPRVRAVYVQRSRGYAARAPLSVAKIAEFAAFVKSRRPDVCIIVDNCYGEFVEDSEPPAFGADMCIGSLIKNPGGGIAQTGGYIAGSSSAVELAGYRMTSPGIGSEAGASLGFLRDMYKGLYTAPHVVAGALKTAVFAAYIYEEMGYGAAPRWNEPRYDIIQSIDLGSPELLCAFCRGIQAGSPVDSHVEPQPWDMPGYAHKVIMAAGTFTQGASIEISADAPLREPFTVYLQGALTFESGKYAVLKSVEYIAEAMRR